MTILNHIYVINMDKDHDRMKFINKQAAKYNLTVNRISGIDGNTITDDSYGRNLQKNQVGCALSHLSIYKMMIDNNIQAALILEDDVTFTPWVKMINKMVNDLPKLWDILWIGNCKRQWPRNTCNLISDPPYNMDNIKKVTKHIYQFNECTSSKNDCPMGLYAYCISINGARKVLESYNFNVPIDLIVEMRNLNKYMTIPSLFVHCYNFGSNIADGSHLKHNPFESIWEENSDVEDSTFDLLKNMHDLFKKYEIRYMIMFGTLLGYGRNKKLIPWDDDIDTCVNEEDISKLENLLNSAEFKSYGIEYEPMNLMGCKNLRYKLFNKDAEPIENTTYKWPFIDIFTYIVNNDDIIISRCDTLTKIHVPNFKIITDNLYSYNNKSTPICVPNNIDLILSKLYSNKWRTECISSSWNHRLEESRTSVKTTCDFALSDYNMNRIWIMFDDGPCPKTADSIRQILDTLMKLDICAIFSLCGEHIHKYSNLVKRIHHDGHIIANHSFKHENMLEISIDECIDSFKKTDKALKEILGTNNSFPIVFPFMKYNSYIIDKLVYNGFDVINPSYRIGIGDFNYSQNSDGYQKFSEKINNITLNNNKKIIGLHSIPITSQLLDSIITKLINDQYEFYKPKTELQFEYLLFNSNTPKISIWLIIVIVISCLVVLGLIVYFIIKWRK